MLVEFENYNDKNRVARDGPWHFDKCLILVEDFDRTQQVKNICMTKASLWVHNLPLMARNEYVGREVGVALSVVEEVDVDHGEVVWGEFMQVWISIDISKPLLQRKKLNLGLSEPVWVQFTYERLPNFCYYCGRLRHTNKECNT